MLADALVLVGFGALVAGVGVVFGCGWALMVGGALLFAGGARLQLQEKTKTSD
jgi:hypothetical protein